MVCRFEEWVFILNVVLSSSLDNDSIIHEAMVASWPSYHEFDPNTVEDPPCKWAFICGHMDCGNSPQSQIWWSSMWETAKVDFLGWLRGMTVIGCYEEICEACLKVSS
ncbi:hypothetical protein TNCV_1968461 [Trichonephila clavipes]|nr:hypothetical protein TNCV_1968461 [Trichonephila clavipes]